MDLVALRKLTKLCQTDGQFVIRMVHAMARRYGCCMVLPTIQLGELPSRDKVRRAFLNALALSKGQGYIVILPLVLLDEGALMSHANFMIGDLRTSTFIRFEPHGSMSKRRRRTADYALYVLLKSVIGKLDVWGLSPITCPHYGPQHAQEQVFTREGIDLTGLCVLVSLMTAEHFLKRICNSPLLSPDDFVDAFRLSQIEVGASNSPFNIKSLDRSLVALSQFVSLYHS